MRIQMTIASSEGASCTSSGCPRLYDVILSTRSPRGTFLTSSRYMYLFLKRRTVLSPRSGMSERNFFNAAAFPFSAAYLPMSFQTASFASGVTTTPIPRGRKHGRQLEVAQN